MIFNILPVFTSPPYTWVAMVVVGARSTAGYSLVQEYMFLGVCSYSNLFLLMNEGSSCKSVPKSGVSSIKNHCVLCFHLLHPRKSPRKHFWEICARDLINGIARKVRSRLCQLSQIWSGLDTTLHDVHVRTGLWVGSRKENIAAKGDIIKPNVVFSAVCYKLWISDR